MLKFKDGGTKDIDRGYKKIGEVIKDTQGTTVDIGFWGPLSYKNQETVTQIATTHEYGDARQNIPQRSFLRSTADAMRTQYKKDLRKIFEKVLTLKLDLVKGLTIFGEHGVSDVKAKIRTNIPPPLSLVTIMRKWGSTMALIDTGTMINFIRHRVNLRGKVKDTN